MPYTRYLAKVEILFHRGLSFESLEATFPLKLEMYRNSIMQYVSPMAKSMNQRHSNRNPLSLSNLSFHSTQLKYEPCNGLK